MPTFDIRSDLLPQVAVAEVISTDTTTLGAIIDTAKFDGGVVFSFICPEYADGTYNFVLEESDDSGMSGAVDITDDKLVGTEAGLTIAAVSADAANLGSIGVVGTDRFIRVKVVSTSTTVGATIAVIAMSKGEVLPVAGLSA